MHARLRGLAGSLLGEILHNGQRFVLSQTLFLDVEIMRISVHHLDAVHFGRIDLLLGKLLKDRESRSGLMSGHLLDDEVARFHFSLHEVDIRCGGTLFNLLLREVLHNCQRGTMVSSCLGNGEVLRLFLLLGLRVGTLSSRILYQYQVIFRF